MAVVIISTGGTIASESDESESGVSPSLGAADLIESVPQLEGLAEIRTDDFSNIPSPQITIEDMYALVERVREYGQDPDIEGMVVTHGTDTLEETSYFVDLCYDGDAPVVFTGAMRHPSQVSPDGPGNLLASVRAATSDEARGRGALVVLHDRVLDARDVVKTNSMSLDTFRSPEFGPLATIDEDRVVWHREPMVFDPTFDPDPEALTNEVYAITATADMAPGQLEVGTPPAVCVAATGAGHIPPTIIEPLESLRDEGVPIVMTTRCHEGRLARHTYDFEGSEATLRDLGVYYSDLPLSKTRMKTIVALAADRLGEAFERVA
ncbi:MAG: asparaginase [Halodesulfurarchaeum sp.]